MIDIDGTPLEINDLVWYRIDADHTVFDNVGIVRREDTYAPQYIVITSSDHMYLEKLPHNVRKMSNEEAMLWKLENL